MLHVAAALELGCTRFVTLDARQARLAGACGLKTDDLGVQKPSSRRG
jgi:predicted nucleic acid-binding protein